MSAPLLAVDDLRVRITSRDHDVRPLRGVGFEIGRGEILGLVGESGCGKSITCLALMGLLPRPGGVVESGSIRLAGRELTVLEPGALQEVRGRRVAMVFQDPMSGLNPYMRLEEQLGEGLRWHLGLGARAARTRAVEWLDRVGFPDPERRIRRFPHELSGGLRQRAMIAMALACEPDLLIADEPTTALDVTIQAQILELLADLRRERGTAILFVTHDLAVVSGLCDRVLVMYAGRVVEEAPARALFERPGHPYTSALLRCTPRLGAGADRMESIEGLPPRLDASSLEACAFAPRCTLAHAACLAREPELRSEAGGRRRRCVLPIEDVP